MATTNMRAIPSAASFIAYCLAPKGKKERVQYVHSTFADHNAELKLLSGKKYDGISFRISFSPSDRKLSESEFRVFAEEVAAEYLGNRNYIAICHNDTEHQHVHIIASFLDASGKALDFAGRRNSDKEAVRRQEIVDTACKKFNLSVLPRQENSFNAREGIPNYQHKGERITKAEKRMKEKGQQTWKDKIRQAVSVSLSEARDFDSFVQSLKEKSITISRETANSLTFSFIDNEKLKVRLDKLFNRMKNRADLEREIAKIQERKAEMISKKEELLRAERAFMNRVYDFADKMLKSGRSEQEVRNRIEFLVLRHKTDSEDIQTRWDALKKMKDALAQEKEKYYSEKKTEYEEQQKVKALQRVMQSDNPILAFAAVIVFLVAELKAAQKQRQQQQEKQKEIDREISMARDILNPPNVLKKQDQKQDRNDNIYIDRVFGR